MNWQWKLVWFGLGIAAKTLAMNYARKRLQEEGVLEEERCCPCPGDSNMRGLAWLGETYKTGETLPPPPPPAPKPVVVRPTYIPGPMGPIPIPALPGTGPMVRTLPDGTVVTGTIIEGQFVVSPFAAAPGATQQVSAEIAASQSEYLKTMQEAALKEAHRAALSKRRAAIEQEAEKRKQYLMRDAARLEALIARTPEGPRRKALEAQYMREYGPKSKTAAALDTLKDQAMEANRHLGREMQATDEMLAKLYTKGASLKAKMTGQVPGEFPAAAIELNERAVVMELE